MMSQKKNAHVKRYRRVIYRSQCAIEMTPLILATIVETSIQNNYRDDITGMLLYADDQFVQYLEGPPALVQACLDRILKDRRHVNLEIMQDERLADRIVPDWNMKLLHEHPYGSCEVGSYDLVEFMAEAA